MNKITVTILTLLLSTVLLLTPAVYAGEIPGTDEMSAESEELFEVVFAEDGSESVSDESETDDLPVVTEEEIIVPAEEETQDLTEEDLTDPEEVPAEEPGTEEEPETTEELHPEEETDTAAEPETAAEPDTAAEPETEAEPKTEEERGAAEEPTEETEEETSHESEETETEEAEHVDEPAVYYFDLPEEEITEEVSLYTDPDTLLGYYIGAGSGEVEVSMLRSSSYNGDKLTGYTRAFYDSVKAVVEQVAAAESNSTIVSMTFPAEELEAYRWTAQELGVASLVDIDEEGNRTINKDAVAVATDALCDVNLAVRTLIRDCPYEMFWFGNKYTRSYSRPTVVAPDPDTGVEYLQFTKFTCTVKLRVSIDYYVSATDFYHTDLAKMQMIQSAVANAGTIVQAASGMGDMEKLTYYMDQICDRVSYNHAATSYSPDQYGNPWQIIYVFDDDPSTNVVCEGYAKGFQYLCDLSSFIGDVAVYSVSGYFGLEGNNGGGHLWNIVNYYGTNYLVDVTNCDTSVRTYDLFMKQPVRGNVSDGYVFLRGNSAYKYVYMTDTLMIYSTPELTMDLRHSFVDGICIYCSELDPSVSDRGTIGNNIIWILDKQGVITIKGTGVLPDYEEETSAVRPPWDSYRDSIISVCIQNGITGIGDYAFSSCSDLDSLTLSNTVSSIGSNAFSGCSNLNLVEYDGTGEEWQEILIEDDNDDLLSSAIHTVDHAFTGIIDAAVEATCTEIGLTQGWHCSVCGEILEAQEEIPALGHIEVIDEAVEATCTQSGLTEGSHCSRCNEVLTAQEEIPALGHIEVIDEAVEATCTQSGLTEGRHCSRCNEVLTAQEEIPALGHIEVIDAAVTPTCTVTGLTQGRHCSRCNEVLTAQEEIPALGHDLQSVEEVAPTAREYGYAAHYECVRCDSLFTDESGENETTLEDLRIDKLPTGWKSIDGSWFYYDAEGKMVTGWAKVGGKWYYLNSSGVMQTGWLKNGGKWYYLNSSGVMQTGWLKNGGKWYYLNSSGVMQTGWLKSGGKWYYLNSAGVMQTGWQRISGKWYYLNSSGMMQTGWLEIGGKRYYLNSSGAMLTGRQQIDGKWYYFLSNGVLSEEITDNSN